MSTCPICHAKLPYLVRQHIRACEQIATGLLALAVVEAMTEF